MHNILTQTLLAKFRSLIISVQSRTNTKFTGIVKVRELPRDCTLEDFLEWWPKLTEREKERWTAYEHKNTLTTAGRNQILSYIASSTSTTLGFGQYFSVGTFPINSVSPGDGSVSGELYRAVPNTATIIGTQLDLATYFGPSQAVGLLTNAGLYGINASATLGSGTLMTHTLYSYNKVNGTPINNDYLINLQ